MAYVDYSAAFAYKDLLTYQKLNQLGANDEVFNAWLNQAVKVASKPSFAGVTLTDSSSIAATKLFYLDGGGDTYIFESSANNVVLYVGGVPVFEAAISTVFTRNGIDFAIDTGDKLCLSIDKDVYFSESSNGVITATSTGFYRSNNGANFDVTSDIRLKENIKPLPSMLNKLKLLKPVTFTYKTDGILGKIKGTKTGFIANDVETVFPEWVKTGSNGYKSINLDGIEAVLVNCIQEQQKQIDALAKRIEKLEQKVGN